MQVSDQRHAPAVFSTGQELCAHHSSFFGSQSHFGRFAEEKNLLFKLNGS